MYIENCNSVHLELKCTLSNIHCTLRIAIMYIGNYKVEHFTLSTGCLLNIKHDSLNMIH